MRKTKAAVTDSDLFKIMLAHSSSGLIAEGKCLVEFILKRLVAERPQLLLGGIFPVPVVRSDVELGCSIVNNFELENPVAGIIL